MESGALNEEEMAFLKFYLNEDEKENYNSVVAKAAVVEIELTKRANYDLQVHVNPYSCNLKQRLPHKFKWNFDPLILSMSMLGAWS